MINGVSTRKNVFLLILISIVLVLLFSIISFGGKYYDADKAYLIVKDALGLAIALLTPFIGIQIYNGWVFQHKSVNNEKITIKYEQQIKEIMYLTSTINPQKISNEKLDSIYNEIAEKYIFIEYFLSELHEYDEESKQLKLDLIKLRENLRDYRSILIQTYSARNDDKYNELNSKLSDIHSKIHNFTNNYKPIKVK